MSTSVYKFNYRNAVQPIKKSRWYYFMFIFLVIGFVIFAENYQVALVVLVFIAIPMYLQIILHFNYYFHDRHIIFEIDYGNKTISFDNGKIKKVVLFTEIKEIIRYQGGRYPNPADSNIIPSFFYHYTTIITKNGEKFKFTDFVKGETKLYGIDYRISVVPILNLIR